MLAPRLNTQRGYRLAYRHRNQLSSRSVEADQQPGWLADRQIQTAAFAWARGYPLIR
jgi:hypothetical protein